MLSGSEIPVFDRDRQNKRLCMSACVCGKLVFKQFEVAVNSKLLALCSKRSSIPAGLPVKNEGLTFGQFCLSVYKKTR